MIHELLTIDLRSEQDVVATRQRAREIGGLAGFRAQDQTSLATAVSELARQAHRRGPGASVSFALRAEAESTAIVVRVVDRGIEQEIPDGNAPSATTTGLTTSRRLVDEFSTAADPAGGTVVTIAKRLPRSKTPITQGLAASIVAEVDRRTPRDALGEMQEQNRELISAFDELQHRQAEIERLNSELAETNRGVLALYAELDEKAESLRRASELKTRFLSDMTHELRTPLNAMISLSQLLLDRVDGELTVEQEKQVALINRSASSLNEMVNDLLDIARIEAGKEEVNATAFDVGELLGALRGMFRPLTPSRVRLEIEEPAAGIGSLVTDERKLTQILRNLLSNAIKFTESGAVSLRTIADDGDGTRVKFVVSDTGIGIGAADLPRIFEDFGQIDSTVQRRVRGSGLGLPLTRKLAKLLGGDVAVSSVPGVGSTFTVTLPRRIDPHEPAALTSVSHGRIA